MVIEDLDEEDRRLLKWLVESGPGRNTPFSPAERAELTPMLGKLLDHFDWRSDHFDRRFDLTNEQFAQLAARLDKLGEASERLGRKDWSLVGIGAITTLVISTLFPPATVIHIGKLFIHKVAHLFAEELAR